MSAATTSTVDGVMMSATGPVHRRNGGLTCCGAAIAPGAVLVTEVREMLHGAGDGSEVSAVRYVLIDVDGGFHSRRITDGSTLDIINSEVGEPGNGQVRLSANADLRGFVNDCGHVSDPPLRINTIGSTLLVALGARQQPYAGPVVITGWADDPHGIDTEVRSLTELSVTLLRELHADITAIVGDTGTVRGRPIGWVAAVRRFATMVSSMPRPQVEVLRGEDAIDLREGMKP